MSQPQGIVTEEPPVAAHPQPAATAASGPYEPCQECGAPMDRQQRYCVSCAARRADVSNPASRYFAAASRQRRRGTTSGSSQPPTTSNGTRAAGVFFFALLPIAVAVGVLVGRGGSSTDDDALLAALRQSDAGAIAAADQAKTEDVSTATDLLSSDFSLDQGFTVKIGALPVDGTDQAAVDQAKSDAEDKGAEDVGIINPGDYATTPDQGQKSYILYSGEFKDRGSAEKALAGLKKDFPDAEVIGVKSSAAAGASSAKGGDVNQNKVVAETSHGTVHQVSTAPPSKEQVEHDTAIVNDIGNQTGEDYTDLQQSLPDVTVVGGNPEDAPPLPTGAGD